MQGWQKKSTFKKTNTFVNSANKKLHLTISGIISRLKRWNSLLFTQFIWWLIIACPIVPIKVVHRAAQIRTRVTNQTHIPKIKCNLLGKHNQWLCVFAWEMIPSSSRKILFQRGIKWQELLWFTDFNFQSLFFVSFFRMSGYGGVREFYAIRDPIF